MAVKLLKAFDVKGGLVETLRVKKTTTEKQVRYFKLRHAGHLIRKETPQYERKLA